MNELCYDINQTPFPSLEAYLSSVDLQKLHSLKLFLDDLYYNKGESPLSDDRYDLVKENIIKRDKSYIPPIGAQLRGDIQMVTLPYFLHGADKITPEEEKDLNRWIKNNPADTYIITEKLDGVSALLHSIGGQTFLYKRGKDMIGADVSYLLPYFKLPPLPDGLTIRGELIMEKALFEREYKDRETNKKIYKNPRNMVAGLSGCKTARVGLESLSFVSYELVSSNPPALSEQLQTIHNLGFKTVRYEKVPELNNDILIERYLRFRKESSFELDGIVVHPDTPYDRISDGNPSYSFAFKMLVSEDVYQTTVLEVEWSMSKWGMLKPVVIVQPVTLPDIVISRATGHNAAYIESNNIGPGTVIKITRSKGVIPYIVDIVSPSETPSMPTTPYTWDKTHVNIYGKKSREEKKTMTVKLLSSFFNKLGVKHVSEATIDKMYESGLTNLFKILEATPEMLSNVPGFGEKTVQRIISNIKIGLTNVTVPNLIGSSGVLSYGVGRKRITLLLESIPNLLSLYKQLDREDLIQRIEEVDGFSRIIASKISHNIKYADRLIAKISKYCTFKTEEKLDDSLKGSKFVMTGFRSKEIEEGIISRGGKMIGSVSKKTTGVITKSKGEKITGKLQKAVDLNVPIYSEKEFISKFFE